MFGELGKKNRAPDGIWTHDPPWSSRMLKLLSYWRLYGEQGSIYGSSLEPHHAATKKEAVIVEETLWNWYLVNVAKKYFYTLSFYGTSSK